MWSYRAPSFLGLGRLDHAGAMIQARRRSLPGIGDPQFSQTPATVVTRYVTVVVCALDRNCRDSSFGPSEVGSVGKVVVTVD
jgi:hypothetical protein